MHSPIVFSVSSYNKKVLNASSSGGAFYHLAFYFLTKFNGVVYGAHMNGSKVEHIRIDNVSDLYKILKSKYVQSELKTTYQDCANDLSKGTYVLFSGTPCQIYGLMTFLEIKKIETKNLLTVDLICHGTPKPSVWNSYLRYAFCGEKIVDVDFRYKKPSWENYSIKITTNKRTISTPYTANEYLSAFNKNYTLLDSCYKCKFKGLKRKSDLTLGDFWGVSRYYPEYYNKNGVSLLFINNLDKKELIYNALVNCSLNKVDFGVSTYCNPSYTISAKCPEHKKLVLSDLDKGDFSYFKKRESTIFDKIKKTTKKFAKKLIINKKSKNIRATKNTIAIITDYGFHNYGNRLQNYALRTKISDLGYNTVNLFYDNDSFRTFGFLHKLYRFIRMPDKKRIYSIRKASVASGDKELAFSYLCKNNNYDTFHKIILGSDQVWNWSYHKNELPFNLGLFCDGKKYNTVSFGASIGRLDIPDELSFLYSFAFSKMGAISVREKNAQTIIKQLGFDSTIVCDPTLLLSINEWDYAIKKYKSKKNLPKRYTLKYVLSTDVEVQGNCINPLDKNSHFYNSNHFDFVNLIKHADNIVTDSFHAVIFSILYKKKITFIHRESMISRFDYLFELLGIAGNESGHIDFSLLNYDKLNTFVDESRNFLKKIVDYEI